MEANPKKAKKSSDTCFWTPSMDEVLIDAYLHQHNLGNKNGNSMTSKAMDSILKELRDHFPDRPISKDKIKDHMKNIKSKFNGCYDLFKNGLSEFGWDATTNMWIAEPEVWDKLIEAKPEAAEWRNKPIPHYDKLAKLFGKDRATGEHAETAAEIRARRAASGGNGNDDTIDDIDHLVSTNEVSLEGFDNYEEEFQPFTSPEVPSDGHSHGATSSRAKKRARKVVEDDISIGHIAKSLEKMVEVFDNLSKSTTELAKQNKNVAAEEVIWEQLEDIGVEPAFLPDVYMHLIHHPDAMKAFNGIPIHKRKEMLPRIMPGYPPNI